VYLLCLADSSTHALCSHRPVSSGILIHLTHVCTHAQHTHTHARDTHIAHAHMHAHTRTAQTHTHTTSLTAFSPLPLFLHRRTHSHLCNFFSLTPHISGTNFSPSFLQVQKRIPCTLTWVLSNPLPCQAEDWL
jgi:hypothetical protein